MTGRRPQAGRSFWTAAANHPDALALVIPDAEELTFAELEARVNRTSRGLRTLGLRENDVVAVCLPNGPTFVVLALATGQIGIHLVPVNFHLTGQEAQYIAHDSGANVLVVADAELARAIESTGPVPQHRFIDAPAAPKGWRSLVELMDGQSRELPDERTGGELMGYTSGTTGRPKGVRKKLTGQVPEESLAGFLGLIGAMGYQGETGAHLLCSPMYHAAPFWFALGSLHLGHALVIHSRFDPQAFLADVERFRITETHMVPTHFHRLSRLPPEVRASADPSSLRSVVHSGAICPVPVKRAMIDWFGPLIWEYLGATESGVSMVNSDEWLQHPGTVGRPFPGVEVKILDDAGRPVPAGEAGTIYFTPSNGVFEYHNDPEKTNASRLGSLSTVGDIGYLDDDGYLYVLDRRVDLIVSGGVNIYPAEVEGHLLAHPEVGDAVVFGVPDGEWGSVPVALVSPCINYAGTEDDLLISLVAHCESALAGYKRPKSLYVGIVPRTPAGKLLRGQAREQYVERQADR